MIRLTIDEKQIEVPEGTTVLRAAQMAGIQIPTLCDHPQLIPSGGCRLCNVEVQGFRGPTASCTLPASQNMVVRTDTDALRASRRFVLTMLFSERNHFCPFCVVSGGDCELQNAAYEEGMTHWEFQPSWFKFPLDASHPNIIIDHNRCILCRRCVRACGDLVGNHTLGMAQRGGNTMLVADYDVPLGESTCVSCGMCIQVCPTGALIDRNSAYLGLTAKLENTKTICLGCSVGCGIEVYTRDNQLVGVIGDWDSPVNHGLTCRQGRFDPVNEDRVRLTTPLVRSNGSLRPATWEQALDAAGLLLQSQEVAAIASTRLSAEALNLFQHMFAKGAGSCKVTTIEEGLPTAATARAAAANDAPFEGKIDALDYADCVLLVGANPADRHAVLSFKIKCRLPEELRLIVMDPEPSELADLAAVVIQPEANADPAWIDQITQALNSNGANQPAEVQQAARLLEASKHVVILYGKGITAQRDGAALAALQRLAHSLPHAELLSVKGEANSLAAAQYGLDQPYNFDHCDVAYLALGDDYTNNRMLERLQQVKFKIVQATYESQATQIADVVFPVAAWSEQAGHFVNLDGRVQKANKLLEAPEGVVENITVLELLAQRLGVESAPDWKARLTDHIAPVQLSFDEPQPSHERWN